MREYIRIVLITCFFGVLMSSLALLVHIGLPNKWPAYAVERFWAHTGSSALILSIYTLVILLTKIFIKISKKGVFKSFLTNIHKWVVRYHTSVGWSIVIIALAHSFFYILKPSPSISDTFTGLLTMMFLFVLTLIGKHLRELRSNKALRAWHLSISIGFIIFLFLHNHLADIHHQAGLYQLFYK